VIEREFERGEVAADQYGNQDNNCQDGFGAHE
jgi:hypothetical protein